MRAERTTGARRAWQDLSGFLPYSALIDTLLHELAHNEHGPHDDQFWHLFCQLKADYLRHHLALATSGRLFSGRSPLAIADATEQARDVRLATLAALERDRQSGPPSPLQVVLHCRFELSMSDSSQSRRGRSACGRPFENVRLRMHSWMARRCVAAEPQPRHYRPTGTSYVRRRSTHSPACSQVGLLDAYMAATESAFGSVGQGGAAASARGGGGQVLGGPAAGGPAAGGGGQPSREEMRALLAARAAARQPGSAADEGGAAPQEGTGK